jgi:hypothetical protein
MYTRTHLRQAFVLAAVTTSLLAIVSAGPASAATTPSAGAVPAESGNAPGCDESVATSIATATLKHGGETRVITLRYNANDRCVWAKETDGQVDDVLWVYNEDTGAERRTAIDTGTDNHTTAISDANTLSHACMAPIYDPSINVCTTFQ